MRTTRIRMTRWIWLTAMLTITSGVIAAACVPREDIPSIERRAQLVNQSIMCPVCPGESLDQSQHPLSVQMRAIVMKKLEDGWTQDQINVFFVERYGSSVLLDPPRSGFNLLVWLVPPIGIALVGVLLFVVLRLMLRPGSTENNDSATAMQLTADDRDRYFHRIEAILTHVRRENTSDDHGLAVDSGPGEET